MIGIWYRPDNTWRTSSTNHFIVGGYYKHIVTGSNGRICTDVGKYKEIVPYKKLAFSWNSSGIKDTMVTVELNPVERGYTELTLKHEGISKREDQEALDQGWKGYLENLSLYFEENNEPVPSPI